MGLKEREFCSYPRCNCPIDKTTICARGLPEPEEDRMSDGVWTRWLEEVKMNDGVWTGWLENPGTGACPVPGWAEDFSAFKRGGNECPRPWYWKDTGHDSQDITHYRYAVPLSLASLARNYSRWGEIVGPVTNTHRMGWVYRDWLRARCDLGYETPGADSQIFGAGAQIPGADEAPSKYHRKIKDVYVDVYDIIHAYGITNPGDQHAIKKMLQPGQRGYKSARQDREEAIVSLRRANELGETK